MGAGTASLRGREAGRAALLRPCAPRLPPGPGRRGSWGEGRKGAPPRALTPPRVVMGTRGVGLNRKPPELDALARGQRHAQDTARGPPSCPVSRLPFSPPCRLAADRPCAPDRPHLGGAGGRTGCWRAEGPLGAGLILGPAQPAPSVLPPGLAPGKGPQVLVRRGCSCGRRHVERPSGSHTRRPCLGPASPAPISSLLSRQAAWPRGPDGLHCVGSLSGYF